MSKNNESAKKSADNSSDKEEDYSSFLGVGIVFLGMGITMIIAMESYAFSAFFIIGIVFIVMSQQGKAGNKNDSKTLKDKES